MPKNVIQLSKEIGTFLLAYIDRTYPDAEVNQRLIFAFRRGTRLGKFLRWKQWHASHKGLLRQLNDLHLLVRRDAKVSYWDGLLFHKDQPIEVFMNYLKGEGGVK